MPLEYAILIVAAVYLVGGVSLAHWFHRPRKPSDPSNHPAE